jgi:von Willebrand factor A domain-containing protein 8
MRLCARAQNHAAGVDFCLVGDKGVGKTAIVRWMAQLLGYHPMEVIPLYRDVTTRDLLQRRITDDKGDTHWRLSPLVRVGIRSHGGAAC